MARKLVVLLTAALIVFIPMSAGALGFGKIRMLSALNEPLHAEVDLSSATPQDIKSLKIQLASQTAFQRSGIDRPIQLEQLKFEIKSRANGTKYIKISTRKSVREPFLNFLLEMNWKNGRMLREYTVLLDPPDRMPKPQPTVVEAPVTKAPEPVVIAEPEAPIIEESPFADAPVPEPAPEPEIVVTAEPDGELFPRTSIAEPEPEPEIVIPEPEPVPSKAMEPEQVVIEDAPTPEPVPTPEAETVAAESVMVEPIPEPELEPIPEPIPESETVAADSVVVEPIPEPVIVEETEPAPEAEFVDTSEPFTDEELFPRIALTSFKESDLDDVDIDAIDVAPAEPISGELDYGITAKGDNLWTIAEKMRPNDGVNIYQVMMALLQSNPAAFVDGNVHRLKVGHVLRIEDAGLLNAMSHAQAAEEYQVHTQAWEEYRQQIAAETPQQPIFASEVDTVEAEAPPTEPSGELTLAAPEGEELRTGAGASSDADASELAALSAELQQVSKAAQAEQNKNIQLNARLKELQEEIDNLQRAVSIKDSEFAALQQQLSEIDAQKAAAPPPVPEPAPVVEEVPPPPAAVVEPAVEEAISPAAEPEVVVDDTVDVEVVSDTPPPEAAMETEIAQAEPETQPTPAPVPEKGLVDQVMGAVSSFGGMLGNPVYLAIGGGAVLILIILMVIIMRRRSQTAAESAFQESILTGAAAIDSKIPATQEPIISNISESSSFLSDFAISGAGAITAEDSEVDPLTEADVFMAYGRYEAAEERLLEAIQSDPARSELKLKLLELYNTNKNQTAFESTAEEFYASIGEEASSDPMWQKVVAMGAELAPDNPLFSGGDVGVSSGTDETVVPASEAAAAGEVMDIGLETGVFQTEDFAAVEEAASAGGGGATETIDFNFDSDSSLGKDDSSVEFSLADVTVVPGESDEDGVDSVLDFNLDTGDEVGPNSGLPEVAASTEDSSDTSDASLDFDLDAGGDTGTGAESADDEPTMMIDSKDLGLEGEEAQAEVSEASLEFDLAGPGDKADDDDSTMVDLNLDAADASDLEIPDGVDEVGTKLDLAKAYIDMGDPDGAKSILDEVMDEGSTPQKQEAQLLIQQIA